MHTARGFSVLYHVFTLKQCTLSSALRQNFTLHYFKLHRFKMQSALEHLPMAYYAAALQPRIFARLHVGNQNNLKVNLDCLQ